MSFRFWAFLVTSSFAVAASAQQIVLKGNGFEFQLENGKGDAYPVSANVMRMLTSRAEGAAAGTIKTEPLISILVPLNKEETQVGVALDPAESAWAVFKCGSETIEVKGGVLGAVQVRLPVVNQP